MSCNFHNSPVGNLKPELFWKHFYALTRIPRPSKHEEKVGEYLIEFAKSHSLAYKVDEVGNVIVKKNASPGYENAPGVVLQGHMDMVCEKNRNKDFDFMTQPIELKRDGNLISADGTSLGADNGAGMAAALAVLEDDSALHPPLECLFTVDEETGMTGAKFMKPGFIDGKYLLNLDSENERDIYIGCAGGIDNRMEFTPEWKDSCAKGCPKVSGYLVMIKGLRGGHSGMEINEGRANAIKLLGRFLWNLKKEGVKFSIASFTGGNKRNAIAREAQALICCKDADALKAAAKKWETIFWNEFKDVENKVEISVEPSESSVDRVLTQESSSVLLNAVFMIPHGVIRMSHAIKDLVETSTNFAIVSQEDEKIIFEMSHRSSSETVKKAVCQRTEAIAGILGFDYFSGEGYPGWQPNMDSKLLAAAKSVYKKLTGSDINVKAIHAGLECGLILEKFPEMEAVSFGPTLNGVHSPDETISISSVESFMSFLKALLQELK